MTKRAPTPDDTPRSTRTGVASSREVAKFLGISEVSLAGLRFKNQGPPFIRIPGGRTIRYRWADIEQWLDDGRVETDNTRRRS